MAIMDESSGVQLDYLGYQEDGISLPATSIVANHA